MYRLIENKLKEMLINYNKPIMLYGARQVGKSYIVQKIAKDLFKDKYLYINFFDSKDNKYKELLKDKTNPDEIINILSFISQKDIDEDWLIIFDEIQELKNIELSFKLFVDYNKKYKIIGLGSYLKNANIYSNISMPVGKTNILTLYPMNFQEYLIANKKEKLWNSMFNTLFEFKQIDNTVHQLLIDELRKFMYIGGMPEVIKTSLNTKNFNDVNKIKKDLLMWYRDDITRFLNYHDVFKSLNIFDNIPMFLAKENKKYMLSNIDKNARYIDYVKYIYNIVESHLIYKINNLKSLTNALINHKLDSEFKMFYLDVGFLAINYNLSIYDFMNHESDLLGNELGGICENFVVNELINNGINYDYSEPIFYYSFYVNKSNNQIIKHDEPLDQYKSKKRYEIDFVINGYDNQIIPIEVKFANKFKLKSLNQLLDINKDIKLGIVLSTKEFNVDKDKRIMYIPLYAASLLTNKDFLYEIHKYINH